MAKVFDGLYGIKNFAFDIIALIADGEKESIKDIEKEIKDNKIINYICNKYSNKMMLVLDENFPYDIEAWNQELLNYTSWVEGNESRKFGIIKKDDGLLLLLGLILDLLQEPKK